MLELIVDQAIQSQLCNARETLAICNSDGRLLGHFIPAAISAEYAAAKPQVSKAELDRRERTGGGRELEAIVADLKANL